MHHRHRFVSALLFAAFCFILSPVSADVVVTKDGSRLNGTITGSDASSVTIKTAFGAEVKVPTSAIQSMSTDKSVHVALKSGNVLFGKVNTVGNSMQVETADGTLSVNDGALTTVWTEGQRNPLLPPPVKLPKWKYEAGLDVAGKTGNSEKIGIGGQIKAVKKSPDDSLTFYGRGARSKENGQLTVKELIGGVDYEANFKERSTWYTRLELEYDDIEALDLRTTAAAGLGRYFVKEANHELRGRLGFQFRHESYDDGRSESSPGLDVGLHHMYKFENGNKLVSDITYTPSFDDFNNYRIYHTSALDVPLASSDIWSMRLGIANEYNSVVATDRKQLDISYFARLVLKWE